MTDVAGPQAGTPSPDRRVRPPVAGSGTRRRHAVVIGASIAGLLAAQVLADGFERVTVVERDTPSGAEIRRGAPQARHLHGLMERGRQIMEELFPGLTEELSERGAPLTEVLMETRWYFVGLRVRPTPTGLTTVLASRPLLEQVLRERVAARGNVVLRTGTTARRLLAAADDPGHVGGVVVTAASADLTAAGGRSEERLAADLVVDAAGRGSRAADWLADLGHRRPAEERVDVDLGYASRLYRRRPDDLDGDLAVVVSTMPGFRGGGAIALEGGRWHVTLAGMLGDHPPTDHDAFTAFAATLPVGDVHGIVRSAEPLSDPVPHRFRGSLRRRYDRLPAPPRGFLALGDAVSSFNPLYAQGMTVAAQHALALRDVLRTHAEPDPRRYFAAAGRLTAVAWEMSTGSDLRYPGVDGPRTLRTRLTNRYVERVQRAAHTDPVVARAFLRTANLAEPPTALLRPAVLTRVLRHGGSGRA